MLDIFFNLYYLKNYIWLNRDKKLLMDAKIDFFAKAFSSADFLHKITLFARWPPYLKLHLLDFLSQSYLGGPKTGFAEN